MDAVRSFWVNALPRCQPCGDHSCTGAYECRLCCNFHTIAFYAQYHAQSDDFEHVC